MELADHIIINIIAPVVSRMCIFKIHKIYYKEQISCCSNKNDEYHIQPQNGRVFLICKLLLNDLGSLNTKVNQCEFSACIACICL
jgi:hypothetical protein